MIRIQKGLTLPIKGKPVQEIVTAVPPETVALLGDDYIGMKPSMAVQVNDYVKRGQLLFVDKKMEAVRYTAPGAGKVLAIHRGARRAFLSLVILLASEKEEEVTFQSFSEAKIRELKREEVITLLLESGLWPALRVRPFSIVADPKTTPHSIFITAIDTNPHAPEVEKILIGREQDFSNGLIVISHLTEGNIYLCKALGAAVPEPDLHNLSVEEFTGPHPAGNVGTHIHFLDPVNRGKTVWHLGLQDVIAIGSLFTTGRIAMDRVISLAGPSVKKPRLLRTRLGVCISDITEGELREGKQRIISGSVFSGRAIGENTSYLGRYHQQISTLLEGTRREFLNWLRPGLNHYSIKNVMLSTLFRGRKFDFSTSAHGEKRAIIPSYNYERVMPLDIMPLFLLRALAIDDLDEVERLGILELDEEDLALCSFVCPSKQDFGQMLRRNLMALQKEG